MASFRSLLADPPHGHARPLTHKASAPSIAKRLLAWLRPPRQ